jgi:hypothetical protein
MNISFVSKEFVLEMSLEELSDFHVSLPECITKSYFVSFTYESKHSSKGVGSLEKQLKVQALHGRKR